MMSLSYDATSLPVTPVEATTTETAMTEETRASQRRMPATAVVVPASATAQPGAVEDRFDYDRSTICVVIHLRPQRTEGEPRQVLLSVQHGVGNTDELPLYQVVSEAELGPLPK